MPTYMATPKKTNTLRGVLIGIAVLVTILFVLIAAVTLLGKNSPEWNAFSPPGGGFTVSMPGDPKVDVVQKVIDGEPIDLHMASTQFGSAEHATYWYDVPMGLDGFDAQNLLEAESDGVFSGVNATVSSSSPTTVDGRPALRVTGRLEKENEDLQALLILNGNRVHMFMTGESRSGAADADRFFDSIQLSA